MTIDSGESDDNCVVEQEEVHGEIIKKQMILHAHEYSDLKTPPQPAVPIPTKIISKPTTIVTPNQITNEKATVDVTPAWFEPVKPVSPENIKFPANYDKSSTTVVRTYECLSTYRSMVKKATMIDFVAEPFLAQVDNTETLVVVLNELACQLGARLTFSDTDYKYNDSDYRTACGVSNLGSIHSLLASEGNFLTAKFNLHLNIDYTNTTRSPETLRNFVLSVISDMCLFAECDKDFIRVFSVKPASSAIVELGITTPQLHQTIIVADKVKEKLIKVSMAKTPSILSDRSKKPFTSLEDKSKKMLAPQFSGILEYLFPEEYEYRLEPALTFLQLQQSDFDPRYNRDYPHAEEDIRGGYPYYFPQGWYRHALKVDDKYRDDKAWLGMNNGPGEWAVAYHGTKSEAVKGIKDKGLLQNSLKTDAMKAEAQKQNPSIPDVKGIYVATHCDGGAANYTEPFTIKDASNKSKAYQVVFQCRVQPGKFTVHANPVRVGKAWRVFDEKAIRPYGLLLKSS
ncbi:unnamed protein product [Rotaria sp. Silwood2]|nr:unnamed protein product [Rotaria sp. Silwood2]